MSLIMQTSFGTISGRSLDYYFGKFSSRSSAPCVSSKNSKKGDEFSHNLSQPLNCVDPIHEESEEEIDFGDYPSEKHSTSAISHEGSQEMDFGGYPTTKFSSLAIASQIQNEINSGYLQQMCDTKPEESEEMDFDCSPVQNPQSVPRPYKDSDEIDFWYQPKESLHFDESYKNFDEPDFERNSIETHLSSEVPYDEDIDYNIDIDFDVSTISCLQKCENISNSHLIKSANTSKVTLREQKRLFSTSKNAVFSCKKMIEKNLQKSSSRTLFFSYKNEDKMDNSVISGTASLYSARVQKKINNLIKSNKQSNCCGDRLENSGKSVISPSPDGFNKPYFILNNADSASSIKSRSLFSNSEYEDKMDKSVILGTANSYSARVQKKIDKLIKSNKQSNCIGSRIENSDKSVISPTPNAFNKPYFTLKNTSSAPNIKNTQEECPKKPVKSENKTCRRILNDFENNKSLDVSLIQGTVSSYPDRLREKFNKILKMHGKNTSSDSGTDEISWTPEICKRLNYNSGYTVIAKSKKVREKKDLQLVKPPKPAVSQVVLHNSGSQNKLIKSIIPGTLSSYSDRIQNKIDKLVKLNRKSKFVNYLLENSGTPKTARPSRVCRKLNFSLKDSPAVENKKSKNEEQILKSGKSTPSKDVTTPIVLHYSESEKMLDKSEIPATNSSYPEKLQKKINNLVNIYKRSIK